MKNRKNWSKLVALGLSTCLLSACSSTPTTETSDSTPAPTTSDSTNNASTLSTSDQKLKLVATNFAEYDWLRILLGDQLSKVELTLLVDTGVDMHSFSPSVDDIIDIQESDLFIYTTGESSGWVDSIVSGSSNKEQVVLDLTEELGNAILAMEEPEGMEPHSHDDHDHEEDHDHDHEEDDHDHVHEEEDHDHDHEEEDHDHVHEEEDHDHVHEEEDHDHDHEEDDHDHEEDDHDHVHEEDEHDHDHDEEDHDHVHEEDDHVHDEEEGEHVHDEFCDHSDEHDEHVWLSLKNAKTICTSLAQQLSALDPDNASEYEENLASYMAELDVLDEEYSEAVKNANRTTMVVADRFPFLYLTNDYKINYFAAFSGCSAETEASFETIVFLANKVDELDLDVVVTTETGNKIADTVISSTSGKDQAVIALNSMQSATTKDSYLTMMEENLVALKQILN